MKKATSIIILLIFLTGCHNEKHSPILTNIEIISEGNPQMAIMMLDSIDRGELSEQDKHLYDLLLIKACDKAYIVHTSDSLILDVIEYYATHTDNHYYPIALYYGGRVFSDMGDYPRAIEYFHAAQALISDDAQNLDFKSTIHSQTGRLLLDLRLNHEAISEIEKSIQIDNSLQESNFSNAYNHHLLHMAYLRLHERKNARKHVDKAIELSKELPIEDQANMLVDLADLMLAECKIDSALNIIRPLIFISDSISLPYTKASAAQIYRFASKPDTAYLYAKQLIYDPDISVRREGYNVIFSDEVRKIIPVDTLQTYILEYRNVIEAQMSENESEYANLSRSRYNYEFLDKEKKRSENKLAITLNFLYLSVLIIFILSTILLFRKGKLLNKKFRNLATLIAAKQLKLATQSSTNSSYTNYPTHSNKIRLKEKILSDLHNRLETDTYSEDNQRLKESEAYQVLINKIKEKKCISSLENDIWENLSEEIENCSPGFFERLKILSGNKITESEKKVAILMKCGIAPSKIAILLGRERNTISTQKKTLALKILGEDPDMGIFNDLIVML